MTIQSFTRQRKQSDVFKFVEDSDYIFDQATLAGGSQANGGPTFDVGTVLGRITSGSGSGAYVQLDPAAIDGSQNFAGIVARRVTVDASTDTPSAIAARGPCMVVSDNLIWPAGMSDAAKATALAQAAAVGIKAQASA